MENKRKFILLFLSVLLYGIVNYTIIFYLSNVYLKGSLIIIISLILSLVIYKGFSIKAIKSIEENLDRLAKMEFSLVESKGIPENINRGLKRLSEGINNNLKIQMEISTKIFNICERLNIVSGESLDSVQSISSAIEVTSSNTLEQFSMLKDSNDLSYEILESLDNIEKDIIEKTEFIADSITVTQNEIKNIQEIEDRINLSMEMARKSSEEMMKLRDYSDEIVDLIDLINSISKETNMLSLNASIEAARAGKHGEGFTVVAMEVGKLASETDEASAEIEEVIQTLRDEISTVVNSMNKEITYMEENCSVIEKTNREFELIVDNLNTGKEDLEDITKMTKENRSIIGKVSNNIEKITSFSEDTIAQMEETTAQIEDQHSRSEHLQEIVDQTRDNVYKLQEVIVGNIMEERMLREVYYVRDYVKDRDYIDKSTIDRLLEKTDMDDIYITDSSGIVEYTSEEAAMDLNLYEADRSFLDLKRGEEDYIATPIKIRVEDGKLFKFLTIIDEEDRLYQVGLSLETLME